MIEICFPQWHVKFPGSALSNLLVHPHITFVVITDAFLQEIRNYPLPARAGGGSSPGRAVDRQDRRWAPGSQDVGDTCCLPGGIALPTRWFLSRIGGFSSFWRASFSACTFVGLGSPNPLLSIKLYIPFFSKIWLGFAESALLGFVTFILKKKIKSKLGDEVYCLKVLSGRESD